MNTKKALLIIDMQKGSFTPATPRYDAQGVVERINKLAVLFRNQGLPVIYIQHDGTGSGEFEKNQPDWEILDELEAKPSDIRIDKTANDCFYCSDLQSTLERQNARELIITGCATDFCVESTVQSALAKNYNVTVVADGHTTGNRPHLNAEKIIEHYNWVWNNMIPTKGKINTKTFEALKTELEKALAGCKE